MEPLSHVCSIPPCALDGGQAIRTVTDRRRGVKKRGKKEEAWVGFPDERQRTEMKGKRPVIYTFSPPSTPPLLTHTHTHKHTHTHTHTPPLFEKYSLQNQVKTVNLDAEMLEFASFCLFAFIFEIVMKTDRNQ